MCSSLCVMDENSVNNTKNTSVFNCANLCTGKAALVCCNLEQAVQRTGTQLVSSVSANAHLIGISLYLTDAYTRTSRIYTSIMRADLSSCVCVGKNVICKPSAHLIGTKET